MTCAQSGEEMDWYNRLSSKHQLTVMLIIWAVGTLALEERGRGGGLGCLQVCVTVWFCVCSECWSSQDGIPSLQMRAGSTRSTRLSLRSSSTKPPPRKEEERVSAPSFLAWIGVSLRGFTSQACVSPSPPPPLFMVTVIMLIVVSSNQEQPIAVTFANTSLWWKTCLFLSLLAWWWACNCSYLDF